MPSNYKTEWLMGRIIEIREAKYEKAEFKLLFGLVDSVLLPIFALLNQSKLQWLLLTSVSPGESCDYSVKLFWRVGERPNS